MLNTAQRCNKFKFVPVLFADFSKIFCEVRRISRQHALMLAGILKPWSELIIINQYIISKHSVKDATVYLS